MVLEVMVEETEQTLQLLRQQAPQILVAEAVAEVAHQTQQMVAVATANISLTDSVWDCFKPTLWWVLHQNQSLGIA